MSHAIEVRDLHFAYGSERAALSGVSFAIEPGECVGLIGPNGAGKSTLLLHLNGLLPEACNGQCHVFVEGQPVEPANLAEIRRKVGLLFQDPNDQLFCPTVYEDVAFGPEQLDLPRDEVHRRVTESLTRVGLTGFDDRSPHHLSVGEKRRVCLAGVLACEPAMLVLDEPSTSLDPRGRRDLKDLLRRIPITKLIATHDLELVVELCPRVMILAGGRIVAEGKTTELLNDEALMLRYDLERPHILRHLHPH